MDLRPLPLALFASLALNVFVGGAFVGAHQFTRIGRYAFAGAYAEVAALERHLVRSARRFPQAFAARFPQFGRIAILQRFAIFGDLVDGG